MKLSRKTAGLLALGCAYALAAGFILLRPAAGPQADRVTIRIAHWQLEGGVRQGLDAAIRRYGEINPGVRVVQIPVPDNIYAGWALTQLVGGDAPDIVEYNKDFSGFAVQQYFEPMTGEVMRPNPYNRGTPIEGVRWRDTFLDAMSSEDGFNRQLNQYYAVTLTQHSLRIIYNRPLMAAITGSAEPPGNYRDLLALFGKTRAYARRHPGIAAPIACSRDTVVGETGIIFSSAASPLYAKLDRRHALRISNHELGVAYLRGDWDFRSAETMTGLELLRAFGENCMPGFLSLTRDAAVMDFVNGRSLMIVAPSWESTSLKQLCAFDIGAFRYPVPTQDDPVYGPRMLGPYSDGELITWFALYLNKATPHRREALDFLHFITSQEGDRIFSDVSGWLPGTVGITAASAFSRQFLPVYDGYTWDSDFFTLSGNDARELIRSSYFLLYGPTGSPG